MDLKICNDAESDTCIVVIAKNEWEGKLQKKASQLIYHRETYYQIGDLTEYFSLILFPLISSKLDLLSLK